MDLFIPRSAKMLYIIGRNWYLMHQSIRADVIPILEGVVIALQPFAEQHEIKLKFLSAKEKLLLEHNPRLLIHILAELLCRLIPFMPPKNIIEVIATQSDSHFEMNIINTGIDLTRVSEITHDIKANVQVKPLGNGTSFSYYIPILKNQNIEVAKTEELAVAPGSLRNYYSSIRNRLKSHFSKADNLVALLTDQHPKDAAFLERVNALIRSNIEDERFDTTALCRAMNMSRTQLFRKLKPLIRQAPAHYIRIMRLEKAKELLETSALNISEVTFKTGFQSPSHFTKAFTHHYGVAPSLFRRKKGVTK